MGHPQASLPYLAALLGCLSVAGVLGATSSSSSVVVVSAGANTAAVEQVRQVVTEAVQAVCAGNITAEVAAEASVAALAQAMAQVSASVTITTSTSEGGSACAVGNGQAVAQPVAQAAARAAGEAIAAASCCSSKATDIARAAYSGILNSTMNATAEAFQSACSFNGDSSYNTTEAVATAVTDLAEAAFVEAFTQLEACKGITVQTMSPSPELPPPSPPIACEPRNCFYNVTEGDTLITVAKRFNVSTRRLIAMNPDIILPETLRVCLDSANSTEPCTYSPKA